MLFYKFTKQLFKNRLDAKLTLGHSNFNRLYSEYPDDFIFIDNSLITILQIPHNLMKEVNKIKARK